MTRLINLAKWGLLLALMAATPVLSNAQMRCALHNSLQGTYAFYYSGPALGNTAPHAGIGVVSFDGTGTGSSTETVSSGGTIMRATASVAYTIKPDCTGTITWKYPDFGNLVVHGDIVISENGKTMYVVGTDAGGISLGIYTKQ